MIRPPHTWCPRTESIRAPSFSPIPPPRPQERRSPEARAVPLLKALSGPIQATLGSWFSHPFLGDSLPTVTYPHGKACVARAGGALLSPSARSWGPQPAKRV